MTENYHTAIATAAPADAATFNAPLGQLDAQITTDAASLAADITNLTNLINGAASFVQLNRGTSSTLTINTGAITVSRTYHKVDTEAAAATDLLDTINGTAGDWLCISPVSAARVVEVRNNGGGTGNIRTTTGGSIYLDATTTELWLFHDGTNWVMPISHISMRDALNNASYGKGFKVPYRVLQTSGAFYANDRPYLSVTPRAGQRIFVMEKAAAATYASIGMAAGTSAGAGALSEANTADTVFVQQAVGAVAGTFGGRRSTTFDLCRKTHYPYMAAVIQIPGAASNIRVYVGVCAAQVTNVDALVTSFLGLRYSTVAADAGWMACTSDGVTTDVLATGTGVAADTLYLLEGWWDGTNWWASANGSTPVSLAANVPADATELGWTCSLITTTASAKNMMISRVYVEFN